MEAMMAELFGRANGPNGGKGGSMHLADFSFGMLGAILEALNWAAITRCESSSSAKTRTSRRAEDRVSAEPIAAKLLECGAANGEHRIHQPTGR